MRRMIPVVVDCILSNGNSSILANGLTCIWIDVEAGEVAAGDIQTNAMALFEHVAYGVENDINFVHFSGFHHFAMITVIAVSGTHNAVRQVQGITLWVILVRRINIDKLGCKVSIWRR